MMTKTKKFWLPKLALFRDKVVDCDGASHIEIPWIWIRKGRTMTIKNFMANSAGYVIVHGTLTNHGTMIIKRIGE